MRKILGAAALTLALYAPAFAGDTPNPSVTEPPSLPTTDPAPVGAALGGEPGGITETLLALIDSVLALF